MPAEQLFSRSELSEINAAVKDNERNSSGEIRIFLEDHCTTSVLDRAAFIFDKLEIKNTRLRNGVLIYMAVDDRRFCVIGDSGINRQVGDDFWVSLRDKMQVNFKHGAFKEGLLSTINEVGAKLVQYFPPEKENINELPDDIVFGDQ